MRTSYSDDKPTLDEDCHILELSSADLSVPKVEKRFRKCSRKASCGSYKISLYFFNFLIFFSFVSVIRELGREGLTNNQLNTTQTATMEMRRSLRLYSPHMKESKFTWITMRKVLMHHKLQSRMSLVTRKAVDGVLRLKGATDSGGAPTLGLVIALKDQVFRHRVSQGTDISLTPRGGRVKDRKVMDGVLRVNGATDFGGALMLGLVIALNDQISRNRIPRQTDIGQTPRDGQTKDRQDATTIKQPVLPITPISIKAVLQSILLQT